MSELEALRAFAKEIFDDYWLEGPDLDCAELQELGVKHGILKHKLMERPCGGSDCCTCLSENGPAFFPDCCYRKTSIIGYPEPFSDPAAKGEPQ